MDIIMHLSLMDGNANGKEYYNYLVINKCLCLNAPKPIWFKHCLSFC